MKAIVISILLALAACGPQQFTQARFDSEGHACKQVGYSFRPVYMDKHGMMC